MRDAGCLCLFYMLFPMFLMSQGAMLAKDEVDKVIEDELTHKLAEDLLQSIERKFQVDLERSVDMVLLKIKLLLQNGTLHIQDRLVELQGQLDVMRNDNQNQVDSCLADRQNETTALAENALHQMVVCGYALIGHDPAQAVKEVIVLKEVIRMGIKPLQDRKTEVYDLLRVCGHDHDSLKKVMKCVISKSPLIKSTIMDISSKLIAGVVSLTKLMARGAMYEACLIEVINTTEEEALKLVHDIKKCVSNNTFAEDFDSFLAESNATVIDVDHRIRQKEEIDKKKKIKEDSELKDMIRRMLAENDDLMDMGLKQKLEQLPKELDSTNQLSNNMDKKDKK